MISQASSEHSICFAVRKHEATQAVSALNKRFEKAISAGRISKITAMDDCSILAIVGQNMCATPGVSAMLFEALASAAVNVRAIAQGASEYNITVVVCNKDVNKALQAVHGRFYLSKTAISVGLVGPGLVGKTLLRQIKEQAATLQEEFQVDLRVVAITGGRKMLLSEDTIDLDNWESEYANGSPANMDEFTQHVLNSGAPNQIIVDCSASGDVAGHYKEWLSKGLNVVTPNKKANSGDLAYYKDLRSIQRNSYTHYFYEATVGAGLPVISTLRSLLDAGDKVERIEGIFSGTLSYIFNTLEPGVKFSDVVAQAKAAGYTEPDPRDDLSGMDVGRKVTILARECGLDLELSDVPIQSLVPESLRAVESVETFMKELPNFDDEIEKQQQAAAAAGEVLRFVGVVDVKGKKGSVELRRYPKDHPFAQLKGSDNIMSFTSRYYTPAGPLVIRGPGAGAEVTAGGVFGDILRVCAYLGAPS
jgi:aspartokinase/homoserine dehydrogenase 1